MVSWPPSETSAVPVRADVLIVDDHEAAREGLAEFLRVSGYAVVTAPNARAAFDAVRGHHPAVILLDLRLPRMDGDAILRRLRAEGSQAAVAMVTGDYAPFGGNRSNLSAVLRLPVAGRIRRQRLGGLLNAYARRVNATPTSLRCVDRQMRQYGPRQLPHVQAALPMRAPPSQRARVTITDGSRR